VLFGGTTGGDQPIAGKIYAVNADTGKPAWTFDVIKNDPASWPGDSGKVGGGSAWMPGTYDESTDTIYIGTSNAAPDYYTPGREGDNKYTATLLAIDPKTGKLKWHRQEIPHDTWDFDAAYEALLVKKDGKDVIVHLNKSGFVFVMDKQDGSLENVWQFAENMNWAKGIDPKTGALIEPRRPQPGKRELLCPNLLGARSWNHGAYNPGTGLWYSHAMEVCNEVVSGKDDPANLTAISALSLGIDEIKLVPPPNGKKPDGRLDARDPLTGKIKWSIRYELPPLSSVLTTGGGLVFTGDMEGRLFAYDADNGKELWRFNAGSGARRPGELRRQGQAVHRDPHRPRLPRAGLPGRRLPADQGSARRRRPDRLHPRVRAPRHDHAGRGAVLFGCGVRPPSPHPIFLDEHNNENFDPFPPGAAARPALLSIATAAVAVAPPADDAKARVAAGKNRFDALCVSCHGAAGTGVAPGGSAASYGPRLAGRTDLDPTLIHERIVRGKHGDKAMPPWGTVLDEEAIEQLTAYVKLIAATQPKAATHLTLAPFDLDDPARVEPAAAALPRPAPATATATRAPADGRRTSRAAATTCRPSWPSKPSARAARAPR
jgi:outer membrane protein assembly factor BamB/mono/diheme cytochrome c family protein